MLTVKQTRLIEAYANEPIADDANNSTYLSRHESAFNGFSRERIFELIQTQRKAVKQKTNSAISGLARTSSAIDAINKGLIRCGFELEFHSINGRSDDSQREIDHDGMRDHASDSIRDSDIIDRMESWADTIAREIMEKMRCDLSHVSMHLSGRLKTMMENDIEASTDAAIENYIEGMDESNWTIESEGMYEDVTIPPDLEDIIDLGEDGSVRGGEIRTIGALTPTKFIKAASHILNNNSFEVDSACSFHVHLSIAGVHHTYGKRFQAELMAYLLERVKALPAAVQKRLNSDACEQYFKFRVSSDKYTAVAFRGDTWEFRLFGSIDSVADARRCLILAIDAMRHAYQVKLGLKESLLGAVESDSIAELARGVVKQGKTFKAVQKQTRLNQQSAGA